MREACWSSRAHALCPETTPDLSGVCPTLQHHHCLAHVPSACLSSLTAVGGKYLSVSLAGKSFLGSTLHHRQPLGPKPLLCLPLTFCLSSQEPRQAWRIACGMACSLLFPAWVVTDTQSWHSVSCGSHSPGRDPRAVRAREKKQSRMPCRVFSSCPHWRSAGAPGRERVVQGQGGEG